MRDISSEPWDKDLFTWQTLPDLPMDPWRRTLLEAVTLFEEAVVCEDPSAIDIYDLDLALRRLSALTPVWPSDIYAGPTAPYCSPS